MPEKLTYHFYGNKSLIVINVEKRLLQKSCANSISHTAISLIFHTDIILFDIQRDKSLNPGWVCFCLVAPVKLILCLLAFIFNTQSVFYKNDIETVDIVTGKFCYQFMLLMLDQNRFSAKLKIIASYDRQFSRNIKIKIITRD